MENRQLILVVDDEDGIGNFMSAVLTANNYSIVRASKGKEAITVAASQCPDLILLDLGLPDIDGLDILKTIRQWTAVPVIVVSARDHEREKVQALDLGADDYITKPFGTAELLARIRTALRHSQHGTDTAFFKSGIFSVGELTINYEKRVVSVKNKEIHLTPSEYKILLLLSKNIGKVLTHEYIIKELWGPYSSSEVQALRVNMANIRRKIEENPAEPRYIVTEVGVGYRMVEE